MDFSTNPTEKVNFVNEDWSCLDMNKLPVIKDGRVEWVDVNMWMNTIDYPKREPKREPTELERIYSIFERKYLTDNKFHTAPIRHRWNKYLKKLGLKTSSVEAVFEHLYSGEFSSVVVKNPPNNLGSGAGDEEIIIMSRDFAQKVLVLGDLP
jgi:hypothetical protein